MNELKVRTGDVIAAEINQIKRQTAQNLLYASLEIGRLLTEAKGTVPHGEWGQWLEANVDYSQSNANNLMRLYVEYGNGGQLDFFSESRLELFGNLSPSQALTLVSLPMDRRVKFVEENNVEEMSVRELKAAILRAEKAEKAAEDAETASEDALAEAEAARKEAEQATAEAERLRKELETAKEELANAQAVTISPPEMTQEELQALREEVSAEYQQKLDESEAKHKKDLEKLVKQKKADIDSAKMEAVTKAKKESDALAERVKQVEAELAAAQEREAAVMRKAQAAASADAQKLAVHFDLVQRELNSIKEFLSNMAEDPRAKDYRGAVAKVLRNYLTELEGGMGK